MHIFFLATHDYLLQLRKLFSSIVLFTDYIKRRYMNVHLSQAKCGLSRSHDYKAPVSKTKPYLRITMNNIGYDINALQENVTL